MQTLIVRRQPAVPVYRQASLNVTVQTVSTTMEVMVSTVLIRPVSSIRVVKQVRVTAQMAWMMMVMVCGLCRFRLLF